MQKYPNLWSEQDRARDPATNRKRRRPDLIHNCVDVCSRGKRTPLLLTAYADFCRMRLRRLPGACRRCARKHESNDNKHSLHFSHKLLLNPMPMFSGELTSQFLLLGSVMLIPRELNETVENYRQFAVCLDALLRIGLSLNTRVPGATLDWQLAA